MAWLPTGGLQVRPPAIDVRLCTRRAKWVIFLIVAHKYQPSKALQNQRESHPRDDGKTIRQSLPLHESKIGKVCRQHDDSGISCRFDDRRSALLEQLLRDRSAECVAACGFATGRSPQHLGPLQIGD